MFEMIGRMMREKIGDEFCETAIVVRAALTCSTCKGREGGKRDALFYILPSF